MEKRKVVSFDKLKNIIREPNVVELMPWKSIHHQIAEPMLTSAGNMDIKDSHLAIGFARITEPVTMGSPAHKHPHDQWIYFIGEPEHFHEFDADIEMRLGNKIVKVNYPCYIFVPKNVMHCPLVVKRVGKPFIFIDARISEEASVRPATLKKHKPVKYIANPKGKKK